MLKRIAFLGLIFTIALIFGCSGGGNSGNPVINDSSISLTGSDANNAIGIMGAYTLSVDPVSESVELNPIRQSAIGESYIVSGIGFFTGTPCVDCLKLSGFSFIGGQLALTFYIRHPFDPGVTTLPPSARNRLDLDVFDLALVVLPTSITPVTYTQIGVGVYAGVVANADGYTRELANALRKQEAIPYVLVVDDSKELPIPTGHYNKFPMGAESFFDVYFDLTPGTPCTFDMYLTMGYGFSAKKAQRLNPTYYNPEFNRKAAWKVKAEADSFWVSGDTMTPIDVIVRVYDWQIGANVDPALLNPSDIYAASEVESVAVEIPGMTNTLKQVTGDTSVSGDGGPDDPLVYEIPIANEKNIAVGLYTGLVRVMDERDVGVVPPTGTRDYLIDSPDGLALNNYAMLEFATYQTFDAEVILPPDWHEDGSWDLPVGPCTLDFGIISSTGHAYVAHTDVTMQCTEIWKYPGWGNPPVFYVSILNLDPGNPNFQPWMPTRIDAAFDGAFGWCNMRTTAPWLMIPPPILNADTYCNFDLNKNFIINPQADDNRHYMVHVPSNTALFDVDCCDTFDGYQCAIYVDTGFGLVGFQGIGGAPQGLNYTDNDIKWEAFFPPGLVGMNPGQVDPADISGIDCKVGPEANTIYVYVALKVNRRVEVFKIIDTGPGPNDTVSFALTINTLISGGAIQCQPIDIELLPAHAQFGPARGQVCLAVLIDNTLFPNPPPGVGGTVCIYSTITGGLADQIGDTVTPACTNIPKFIDINDNEFSVHIMQQGPKVTKIDYF